MTHTREPFVRRLIAASPWLVAFTVFTAVLESVGLLAPYSNFGEDTFVIAEDQRLPSDVRIVEIDDATLDHVFHNELGPRGLATILDAVERAKPRLIAVDIITGAPRYARFRPEPSWTQPIVWAEDFAPDDPACQMAGCAMHVLAPFGGTARRAPDGCAVRGLCAGVPVFVGDPSKTIRSYERTVEIPGLEREPTFPWAALTLCTATAPPQLACEAAIRRSRHAENRRTIRYDAQFPWPYTMPAERALAFSHTPGWATDSELRGHIVIVGATYRNVDRHTIPGGVRPGVWINAQVIENELGRSIAEVPWELGLVLDVLVGIALVYLLWRLPALPALGASVGLIAVVLGISYLLFHTMSAWLNFAPIVVGVVLHDFSDHVTEYLELRRRFAAETSLTPATDFNVISVEKRDTPT